MSQASFNILIDFEATELDTSKARPIEVGLALVDEKWDHVVSHSAFLYEHDYPELSKEVSALTHIEQSDLVQNGTSFHRALMEFDEVVGDRINSVKYAVAYNREYDESVYKTEALRVPVGLTRMGNCLLQIPWLCAMRDLESNYKKKCWTQSHLALDYGITVDPNELHRAIGDVYLMRKILAKAGYSADDIYKFQQEPWIVLQAVIPAPWTDGGKGVAEAKARGYSWEQPKNSKEKFEKSWVKLVKERNLEQELKESPFKVTTRKGGQNG